MPSRPDIGAAYRSGALFRSFKRAIASRTNVADLVDVKRDYRRARLLHVHSRELDDLLSERIKQLRQLQRVG